MYDDIVNAKKLIQRFGNEYAATMYVVKAARMLLNYSKNAITESEAILWVVNGKSMSELDDCIKKRKYALKHRKYSLINEYASLIDSRPLEIKFRECAIKSNKAHRLIIDYGQLDSANCTRLRILLKQYWIDHLQNEMLDKPLLRNDF